MEEYNQLITGDDNEYSLVLSSDVEKIFDYIGLSLDELHSLSSDDYVEVLLYTSVRAIQDNNEEMFTSIISLIGIDKFSLELLNETMVSLIVLAYRAKLSNMVDVIFDAFDADNPVVQIRPSATTFFTIVDPSIDNQLLHFVALSSRVSYGDHMYNLVNYGSDITTDLAIERLEMVYGEPSVEFLDRMMNHIYTLDLIYDNTNIAVARYCIRRMKDNEGAELAEIPSDLIRKPIMPTVSELERMARDISDKYASVPRLMTSDQLVDQIMRDKEKAHSVPVSLNAEIRNQITSEINSMTDDKLNTLMREYIKASNNTVLQKDLELFRIYGPSFPGINVIYQHPECRKFGGCRMLLCVGHTPRTDADDDEEAIDFDWFTGSCTYCTRKIPNRWSAKRMPIPTGGWASDTYCSWQCVIDDITEPDFIITLITKYLQKKCDKVGIYDRIEDPQTDEVDDDLYIPPGYFESLAGYSWIHKDTLEG